jgi:hypothetical protein
MGDHITAAQRLRDNTARVKKGLPPPEPAIPGAAQHAPHAPHSKTSAIAADIMTMERDLERRERSYADREAAYMSRIHELSAAIESTKTRDSRIR